jgi:hypothetical protein
LTALVADLPERVVIDGTTFSRVDSDDSFACWTWVLDAEDADDTQVVSLLMEPAAMPGPVLLELAGTIVSRFGELAELADNYLRHRLREPRFGLRPSELSALDASEVLFDEPVAVIWADGNWMLRFAESSLEMADPFGIGVRFEGMTPSAVEDLSGAELS